MAGEDITVHMELDTAARVITSPPDLRKKLRGPVKTAWDKLSYTRQKEFAESLTGAKRPETRARRLAKVLDALR